MAEIYELIQVALGIKESLGKSPSEQEWTTLYGIAQKQAVIGVAFTALNQLAVFGQRPPVSLLYEWIGAAENIKAQNHQIIQRCIEVSKIFADAGYRSCILKGQGNALLYDVGCKNENGRYNLASLRQPGDIDIWIEGNREDVRRFVMSKWPYAKDGPMHISFHFHETEVEAHYIARRTSVPKYNKRLQRWLREHSDEQFSNRVSLIGSSEIKVCVPTVAFNAVYQMSHMMGHFFVEGMGLRHFVDYFYVLKKLHEEGCTEDYVALFEYLGLLNFARGVMWIEKEMFGLSEKYLICDQDERIGRVILKEMEEGGNFGQYNERYAYRRKGYLARGIADGYRLLKLAYYFPQDALWRLVRMVENQKWKMKNKK